MNDRDQKNLAKLSTYLPDGTAEPVFYYLKDHKVSLKIKNPRSSKLGDYRHPHGNLGHRISINGNLNMYAFLITMVHEMAHLETWIQKRNNVEPHGNLWKLNFQKMLKPFVSTEVLPTPIVKALDLYLKNPRASSCSDVGLSRSLSVYDDDKLPMVESLKEGSIFTLPNGRAFKKGKKLRKRYKCLCLTDKRWYYVSPLIRVEIVNELIPENN